MRRVLLSILLVLGACNADDSGATTISTKPDAKPRPDAGPKPDAMAQPMAAACDVANQDCTDATNKKCTLVDSGDAMSQVTSCVAPTGDKKNGETCARVSEMEAGWGHDDCASGWCSGYAVIPPEKGGIRVCRAFCHDDFACTGTERCLALTHSDPMDSKTPDGFCIPSCSFFSETDCDAGMVCAQIAMDADKATYFETCRQIGTAKAGDACNPQMGLDCEAGSMCLTNSQNKQICFPMCDKTHACADTTLECLVVFPGLPNEGGICGKNM